MSKSTVHVLTVSILVGLAAWGCGSSSESQAAATTTERIATVRVLGLATEAATDVVSLPADLKPARRAILAAEVPGRIESLSVEVGDTVTKEQSLLTIDRRALEQTVREAEAVFFQRTQQFERAQNLFAKQSITKAQMLDALTFRDVAQASLDSARLQLSKSSLRAPWSGRVAARRVELGDYAQPGQPLIELIAVGTLKVQAPVAASDVPFVAIGSPVSVRIDAFPDRLFQGTIVRTGAELDPRSRTLEVEAELNNAAGDLTPGLPARIELVRRQYPEALLLPASAVIRFEDHDAVYVVEDDRAVLRQIGLGPLLGERVLVNSGLVAGDEVVVEGQSGISDGQPVEVLTEDAA